MKFRGQILNVTSPHVLQCLSTFFEPQRVLYTGQILQHSTNQKCYKITLFTDRI